MSAFFHRTAAWAIAFAVPIVVLLIDPSHAGAQDAPQSAEAKPESTQPQEDSASMSLRLELAGIELNALKSLYEKVYARTTEIEIQAEHELPRRRQLLENSKKSVERLKAMIQAKGTERSRLHQALMRRAISGGQRQSPQNEGQIADPPREAEESEPGETSQTTQDPRFDANEEQQRIDGIKKRIQEVEKAFDAADRAIKRQREELRQRQEEEVLPGKIAYERQASTQAIHRIQVRLHNAVYAVQRDLVGAKVRLHWVGESHSLTDEDFTKLKNELDAAEASLARARTRLNSMRDQGLEKAELSDRDQIPVISFMALRAAQPPSSDPPATEADPAATPNDQPRENSEPKIEVELLKIDLKVKRDAYANIVQALETVYGGYPNPDAPPFQQEQYQSFLKRRDQLRVEYHELSERLRAAMAPVATAEIREQASNPRNELIAAKRDAEAARKELMELQERFQNFRAIRNNELHQVEQAKAELEALEDRFLTLRAIRDNEIQQARQLEQRVEELSKDADPQDRMVRDLALKVNEMEKRIDQRFEELIKAVRQSEESTAK